MTASPRDKWIGTVCVLGAITAWGVYFPYAKLVLLKLSPTVFLIFRLGVGAAILFAIAMRRRASFRIRGRDVPAVVGAGAIGIILHQLLQLHGLARTTATNTAWILTLIPPVSGVLGWTFLKERVSIRQVSGIGVAMIGLLLFVTRWRPTTLSLAQNHGDFLALASVFTWSTYIVITKSRLDRYSPIAMTTIHMTLGFAYFLLAGFDRVMVEAATLDAREWGIVVAIGAVPSGLAYYWWNAGLKRLTVVSTAAFVFIEAVVASLAGFVVLGEAFTFAMAVAAGLIVLGVFITQQSRR